VSRRAGMFGSEAGLVRINKAILTTSGASADSGATCQEAKAWRNWTFTVEGTFTGYTATWYGTNDPKTAGTLPGAATPPFPGDWGGVVAITPTQANWFLIPAEAIQTGTGVEVNPLTSTVQSLSYDRPLLAVRCVIAGSGQTGTITARVAAVP
jgi:hypothetical protein